MIKLLSKLFCNKKQIITEEMNVHKDWYERAKKIKYKDLPKFIDELLNGYCHDYVTICHAFAASAVATVHAMNKTKQGGITGFQASIITWCFIRKTMGIKGMAKIIEYDNMLYPQYEEAFQKTISKDTFEYLQEQAKEKLSMQDDVDSKVKAHWQNIVDGVVPFGYQIRED